MPSLERPLGRGLLRRASPGALAALLGWRVVLAQPVPRKCVMVFYPHTSNWDFPIGLLAKWVIGIDFRWVGKDTLFARPLGAHVRALGRHSGRPSRRAPASSTQVAAMFAAHDDFRAGDHARGHARAAPSTGRAASTASRSRRACRSGSRSSTRATRRVGIGAWLDLRATWQTTSPHPRVLRRQARLEPAQAGPIRFRARLPE